eukprot:scaffold109339_cov23-Tisochrysis_lutea.AAC.1
MQGPRSNHEAKCMQQCTQQCCAHEAFTLACAPRHAQVLSWTCVLCKLTGVMTEAFRNRHDLQCTRALLGLCPSYFPSLSSLHFFNPLAPSSLLPTTLSCLQERMQMRKQRQLEEQAEAARRSRVAVTIDLLGRRVGNAQRGLLISKAFYAKDDGIQGCSIYMLLDTMLPFSYVE